MGDHEKFADTKRSIMTIGWITEFIRDGEVVDGMKDSQMNNTHLLLAISRVLAQPDGSSTSQYVSELLRSHGEYTISPRQPHMAQTSLELSPISTPNLDPTCNTLYGHSSFEYKTESCR